MIEVLKAKTGDLTVRFAGKFLASAYDPRAEGEVWAEKNLPQVTGLKTVFVLGAAAGYHLESLKMALPHLQLICIERRQEIYDCVRAQLNISLLGIQLIRLTDSVDVFSLDSVRSGLKMSYGVLRSQASMHLDQDFYKNLQLDLNARSEKGFREICAIRGLQVKSSSPELGFYSFKDLAVHPANPTVEQTSVDDIVKELII